MTPAQEFLRELKRALPLGSRGRVLAELREHIDADVRAEVARGLTAAEAEAVVVARLGDPRALAAQFDTRSPGRQFAVTAGLAVLAGAAVLGLFSARGAHHARRPSGNGPSVALGGVASVRPVNVNGVIYLVRVVPGDQGTVRVSQQNS